jgi:DNA replication protein DnaC
LYDHAPKLFRDLQLAQADGSLARRLQQWSRIRLLIIDDLGLAGTGAKPYRELLEKGTSALKERGCGCSPTRSGPWR